MRAIIHWFAHNPIAANLMMLGIIVGGLVSAPKLDKEFFPRVSLNLIQIQVPYPGAGPKEVEEQISVRIEEVIHDLDGIERISSTAREGMALTQIEVAIGYDMQQLLNNVKNRVDSLTTLPQEAENPQISEIPSRSHMISLALSGDVPERTLKRYAYLFREELAHQPYVGLVELSGTRLYEVSIEVSEITLRKYNLTFEQVIQAIRDSSLNLPAGSIRAEMGDIQLQTRGQAYDKQDFESIILIQRTDGTQVRLGEVATIIDGFEDKDIRARFNGEPAVFFSITQNNNPNVLKTSESVRTFVKEYESQLPPGLSAHIWRDASESYRDRINTLLTNGVGGLILVFIVLMLFLRPLLAMWVCTGIAVSFLGALWLLPYTGMTLNMMSLFAFLLILGIVVDDAIIVGESIHSEQQGGYLATDGAVRGAFHVAKPILFAVISTMIVFIPMFFFPGHAAESARSIPTVVLLALSFSLLESLLILPSHLANMRPEKKNPTGIALKLETFRLRFANGLIFIAKNLYLPLMKRVLSWHWVTMALFFCAFLLSIAIFIGGWVPVGFFPNVTADNINANIVMPDGSPFEDSERVLVQVEQAALELKKRHPVADEDGQAASLIGNIKATAEEQEIDVRVEINRNHRADADARALSAEWRRLIGDLGNVDEINMGYTINRSGKDLQFILSSSYSKDLSEVSQLLKEQLHRYAGVHDISDSMQQPRPEMELKLKPLAETLSIKLADLARQIRYGFYGAEVQRIPRDKEDVKVMVRYPREERESIDQLRTMRIRTPTGNEVPFETLAEIHYKPSYSKIERIDRQRTVTISADYSGDDPNDMINELTSTYMPGWKQQYPGISMELEGEQKERAQFNHDFITGALQSLLAIYCLFAVAFRSYWQPIIILTAVPFGFMGSVFGHLIMDIQVSIFSMLGMLACAGVVVNDNLVFIDRINQLRGNGLEIHSALFQAGLDRFRPIVLTSLTTFIGLVPIMSETSLQAQFLIPMVTSLAFGVLFATAVTLLLVPCLYLVGEQFKERLHNWRVSVTN